jgi:hypothetical protein
MGSARPPPFTIVTITYKVAVYAATEWADTLTLFHLYQCFYSVVFRIPRPLFRTKNGDDRVANTKYFDAIPDPDSFLCLCRSGFCPKTGPS